MSVPRDVQRCPAVPKPENSAPCTASSMSALGVTTIGFLPPSSRHGLCRWRPASSPMRAPTVVDPVNPILSIVPACSPSSRPPKASSPSAKTMLSTPSGRPAAWISSNSAMAEAAAYSACYQRRDEIPGRHRDGEIPRRQHRDRPHRHPEREELLVRHLAGDRLAIQAPALAEEEVAGVDDLLNLAKRLRVGLTELTGYQAGQGLLVGLDDAADRARRAAADGSGHICPRWLGPLGRRACGREGRGVGECHLGDHVREPGRVRRADQAGRRALGWTAADNGNEVAGHADYSSVTLPVRTPVRWCRSGGAVRPIGR